MQLNPNSIVYNVEIYKHIIEDYKEHCEYPDRVIQNKMPIKSFLKKQVKNNNNFDIIFYDCHNYVSDTMIRDLQIINENKLTNEISITLNCLGDYPGRGKLVKTLKEQCKHFGSKMQLMMLYALLPDYSCVDVFSYLGCYNGKQKSPMVVYKFKLK